MPDIVVGIDGSPCSVTALEWAVHEAELRRADIRAVLAWAPEGRPAPVDAAPGRTEDDAEAAAARLLHETVQPVRDRHPNVKIHERIVWHPPVSALVEESEYAAMLVVGSRGISALRRALIGSVSSSCARDADAPVVVVRTATTAEGSRPGTDAAGLERPIVVGIDGSPASRAALDWAAREASLRGAPLRVLHTWTIPPAGYGQGQYGPPIRAFEDAERAILDDAVADALGPVSDVSVTSCLIAGHPAHGLITAAHDAALLVVGARGHGGFAGLSLGSVSHQCVVHSPCPVAVIRTPAVHPPIV